MIKTFSISAIGAASIIGLLAFGTSAASAKSVTSCHASNSSSVMHCCEQIVAQNGKPNWMRVSGTNCRQVVQCNHSKQCYILPRLVLESRGKRESGRSLEK